MQESSAVTLHYSLAIHFSSLITDYSIALPPSEHWVLLDGGYSVVSCESNAWKAEKRMVSIE
jgi:hypothetical protein